MSYDKLIALCDLYARLEFADHVSVYYFELAHRAW